MLATQNPIEQEGTYPLPEAQLDRSCSRIWSIIRLGGGVAGRRAAFLRAAGEMHAVLAGQRCCGVREAVTSSGGAERHGLRRAPRARHAAAADGQAPNMSSGGFVGRQPARQPVLDLAGRARAACQGRFNVACEDVAALAPLVLPAVDTDLPGRRRGQNEDEIIGRLVQEDAANEP